MKKCCRQNKNAIYSLLMLLLTVVQTISAAPSNKLSVIAPSGGISLAGNTPLLSWTAVECDYYTVWIDGRLHDTIRATLNGCVPFPLSFGKHSWRVEAHGKSGKTKSETAFFSIDDKPLKKLPENAILLRPDWKVQSFLLVKDSGDILSGPRAQVKGWHTTSVPATALTALVRNGAYPNPYAGMNNMRIPDSNDEYNRKYDLLKYSHIPGINPWKEPYWFRTEFVAPDDYAGKKIWLEFDEINYRADIWLNGQKLADSDTIEGMEHSFRFEASSQIKIGGKNYLAVAIHPVNHPGEPSIEPLTPLGEPGTNMADGMISKNYTKWDAVGWDWQPAVRDRDLGITGDVFLYATQQAELKDIYVTADLPLPDTTSAALHLSAELVNHGEQTIAGIIRTTIMGGGISISFEKPFEAAPRQTVLVDWNSQNTGQLNVKNPALWWPAGHGQQNLYHLRMEMITDGEVRSRAEETFGIREIETYVGPAERIYRINGRDIYLRGGNWVLDMMLTWNARRYEDEILLTRNANLNILRVWGPTGVAPEAFYEAADKYGILIWQDFLHDFWGTFRNTPGFTPGDEVYRKATTAIVKKLRNHPSLIIWCGANEGVNPREEMITKEILPLFDGRSTRHYLKRSDGDGLHGGGPYHTMAPEEYFLHKKLSGFSSEIGPSGVPVYESAVKFIPEIGKTPMEGRFPIDGTWAYHDANDWPGNDLRKFSSYDNQLRQRYGEVAPTGEAGIREYFRKAQMVNYDVYRAAMESINRQLWTTASGMLLWKSNSSWTSLTWQLYDWYLQAHAGYYATRAAGEPVHIQFNRDKWDISIINTTAANLLNLTVRATLYTAGMKVLWTNDIRTALAPRSVLSPGWTVPLTEEPCFLRLLVLNPGGEPISRNFYWLSSTGNLQGLNDLPEAQLRGEAFQSTIGDKTTITVKLTNQSKNVALMTALRMQGEASGLELLPTFWNNNYISLMPGETIVVKGEIRTDILAEPPVISCQSYNMKEPFIIKIQ